MTVIATIVVITTNHSLSLCAHKELHNAVTRMSSIVGLKQQADVFNTKLEPLN